MIPGNVVPKYRSQDNFHEGKHLSLIHILLESPKAGPVAYRLFELLPTMPRFTVERARQKLGTTFPTANAAVRTLADLGIVAEMTGQKKNRSFAYPSYIALLVK